MDEVIFKVKFILQNMDTNVQVKAKWKFTWCWVHSMKLKLLKLALRCWPTTPTNPTTWSRSRKKDMKTIIRRSSQVQFHVKSHQSSKKPFILISYCSWFNPSSILYVKLCNHACWSPELLLHHDFNITYFHKLSYFPTPLHPTSI